MGHLGHWERIRARTSRTPFLANVVWAGAAVIAVDHLPKNPENRANGATGTAAKRRAVGGVAIRVTIEDQFAPGQGGSAWLTINKDRHGGLRRHCLQAAGRESVAALFRIEPGTAQGSIRWSVDAPKVGDAPKGERVDPDDLAALDELEPPPASVRDVKERCRWRTDRAARTLREWRSRRSPGVPGERGTPLLSAAPDIPADGDDDHDRTEGDE